MLMMEKKPADSVSMYIYLPFSTDNRWQKALDVQQ